MAAIEVDFFPGLKSNTYIITAIDGHAYHVHSFMNGGRISLRCIHHRSRRRCRAKASVNADGTEFRPGRIGYHNHTAPNYLKHQRRFRAAVLAECRLEASVALRPKKIYNNVRSRLRLRADQIGGLTYVKMRSSMLRARRENLPRVPHSISELAVILEDPQYEYLASSLDGDDLIYMGKFGQTKDGTRAIMFSSHRMLWYMAQHVEEVLSDATFCVPAVLGCRQVWNIITLRRHHVIVLARFVMQTKSEECYLVCLQAIKAIVPDFRPKSIMCDFEIAQSNAWESVYPLAVLSGCLFHSSKAIALHAAELGLLQLIRQNELVDSLVRSLCALAFLPVNKLEEGLLCIATRARDQNLFILLEPMLEYVRKTWFKPNTMHRLSVFGCPDRTTNGCESANGTLSSECGSKKPSVFAFLHAIKQLDDSNWFNVQDLQRGYTCSRSRPISALANDEIVRNLSTDLTNGQIDVDMFLREISRRIQGVYEMVLNL